MLARMLSVGLLAGLVAGLLIAGLQQVMTTPLILVADDEPEVRRYLETALRCEGYAVELAGDGDEVLGFLQAGMPVSAITSARRSARRSASVASVMSV